MWTKNWSWKCAILRGRCLPLHTSSLLSATKLHLPLAAFPHLIPSLLLPIFDFLGPNNLLHNSAWLPHSWHRLLPSSEYLSRAASRFHAPYGIQGLVALCYLFPSSPAPSCRTQTPLKQRFTHTTKLPTQESLRHLAPGHKFDILAKCPGNTLSQISGVSRTPCSKFWMSS